MDKKNEIRPFFERQGGRCWTEGKSPKELTPGPSKTLQKTQNPNTQTGGNGTKQRYTCVFCTEQHKHHWCGSDILTKHRASYLQTPGNARLKEKEEHASKDKQGSDLSHMQTSTSMETRNKKHEDTVWHGCMQKGLKQNGSGLGKHRNDTAKKS